jgi:hypothetical protein
MAADPALPMGKAYPDLPLKVNSIGASCSIKNSELERPNLRNQKML